MWKSIQSLDRILKGEATRLTDLRRGTLDIPLGGLSLVILILGAFYGACMGAFAIIDRSGTADAAEGYKQLFASAVKVPALFFLTLAVTFPSLYVFNALVGSRLSLGSLLRLLVAALAVMMALLASFGTITVFFAVSTDSYAFMVLLNVVLFAVAGILGLGFLLQTLHRLHNAQRIIPDVAPPPESYGSESVPPGPPPGIHGVPEPGALDAIEGQISSSNVRTVFKIWVVVFALVGAQMGWILRPFIGDPDLKFEFFRKRDSDFFHDVIEKVGDLMSDEKKPPRRDRNAPSQGADTGSKAGTGAGAGQRANGQPTTSPDGDG